MTEDFNPTEWITIREAAELRPVSQDDNAVNLSIRRVFSGKLLRG